MSEPLIPRSVLFGDAEWAEPTLSPDGTRIGYLAPHEGVLNVWSAPVDTGSPAVPVTTERGCGVRRYFFCDDNRHLLYATDSSGREDWRLFRLELRTGEVRPVTPESTRAQVLGRSRLRPGSLLVGLNADEPSRFDLHRLDVATGRLERVAANPGFVGWLTDGHLRVRGGIQVRPDGGMALVLGAPGSPPGPTLEIGPEDAAGTEVVGFSRDGTRVFLRSSIGADTIRLLSWNLATGARTVLAQDTDHDVDEIWIDPVTLEPQVAVVVTDRRTYRLLDPAIEPDLRLLRLYRDGEIAVSRTEHSDSRWIVSYSSSDRPVDYALYTRADRSLQPLLHHQAEPRGRGRKGLRGYRLAITEPFVTTSRDGLRLNGYLTFPVSLPRAGLPCVVVVHGGPWRRDMPGYNPRVQWLANRGYVCLQVNFRGSTGYGKAFLHAGDREWGAKMNDDLLDAVAFTVGEGWVDPARIGVFGHSYGGYAALAAVAFTPGVFRCAVVHSGFANLLALFDSLPPHWTPLRELLCRRVGDPATEPEFLLSRSPISRVSEAATPLLLARGGNDPRVPRPESQRFVKVLRDKGVDCEELVFPGEGHTLTQPANVEQFAASVERFLARHLGGRTER